MADDDWIREDDEWPQPNDPDDGYEFEDEAEAEDDAGYDDGGPRGSTRAWAIALALVLVLGVGIVAALAITSDDDGGESASDVDTGSSTTSTTRLALPGLTTSSTTAASSSTSSTVGVGGSGGGTGSTTSTTKKPTTTTISTSPEDTNDPKCSSTGAGDVASDPNPISISFCVEDGNPKVGQTVKIHGSAVDHDSQIEENCVKVTFDDEPVTICQTQTNPANPVINRDFTVTHVFTTPGDHTIHAAAVSDPPHGSAAATSLKVTVHA